MSDEKPEHLTITGYPGHGTLFTTSALTNARPFGRISEIAARLDVKPHEPSDSPTLLATGDDGKHYDIWKVVAAFLDKVEAATPKRKE
jgi:hypothetical protein